VTEAPVERVEPPLVADERTMLDAWLDYHRAAPSTHPEDGRGDFSVRWIYVHMIEEYARHNGHADLLRERIDGAKGD
jgi:hypothetical protein